MESFQRKELVTRRSLKYTYFVSPSGESSEKNPALLFLHGFPDSAHLWSEVVAKLGDLPNKIIIPDCLGYAGTDKPEDTSLYAYDGQADDVEDILKKENANFNTVIIGHDWGSALAQRVYLHKSYLCSGLILLNMGYMVPTYQPFDLDVVNTITTQQLGYPRLAYWEFFVSPDAADILDGHLEKMWQVLHGDVENWMQQQFSVSGAMRKFILGDEQVPLKPYAQKSEWKNRFIQQFKTDGFASALQMYKAAVYNVQSKSDSTIPRQNLKIQVPLLFIICTQDTVCLPSVMIPAKDQGLVPKLKEVVIQSAHWSPMEKPDEIAMHIKEFLADMILSH
jgi:pimeloyl-ACP methyl ester carboxylesterase